MQATRQAVQVVRFTAATSLRGLDRHGSPVERHSVLIGEQPLHSFAEPCVPFQPRPITVRSGADAASYQPADNVVGPSDDLIVAPVAHAKVALVGQE